ncbi:MAG: acyltransferase family protein [Xanthobacteraceae bacterium]
MSKPRSPAGPENQSHGRVEVLDLLRLLAVFAVLLFHYGFRGAVADGFTEVSLPGLVPVAKYGYLGVQLFFIISGFVIAYSAEGRTASAFAVARAARIYPTFVLCMTVTFLLALMIGAPRFEASITQWLANLIVVSPALKQPFMDGAYWSIVYEITFYGWVFLLLLFNLFRRETVLIVVVWLAISIVNETIVHSGALLRLFLTDQSAFFCIGLVLYQIFRGRRDRTIMLLLALSTAVAVTQAFTGADWMREHYHTEFNNLVIAAVCIASVGLVAFAMNVRRLPLPAGVVLAIGGLTYPLYLLHQHIGYMLFNKFAAVASAPVLVVLAAVLVTAASFLIWRFFENPVQKRFKQGLSRAADWLGGIAVGGAGFLLARAKRFGCVRPEGAA